MPIHLTKEQNNANRLSELIAQKYINGCHNYFLTQFLKDFVHIDTYFKENGDVRLQGWYKPTAPLDLPECTINEFDEKYGIFIAVLNVKPFIDETAGFIKI